MGLFKSLFKPVKSIFKGIKNKILKPTERFLRKHKKTLLTAALITGLVFTGGALAGAGWASGFGSALGIGPAAATAGTGAVAGGAPIVAGGASTSVALPGINVAVGTAAPTATQLAASTAAYGSATSLATGEAASLLAGTPEEPFIPGSPRFSRMGIGQRYDRPSMETLNFGIGGSTVNPYVS
tara:strand:- start:5574 stop:6122 length:549 start_codon:yes stop_codon:yes gene_type:complete